MNDALTLQRGNKMFAFCRYFAHAFAPSLDAIPRRIVFVLDISGSMSGLKIEQLQKAMRNILQQLDSNVSDFSYNLKSI